MSIPVAVVQQGQGLAVVPQWERNALVLPESMEFEAWSDLGENLRLMEGAVLWWLGDWWNYGERLYGEMASQAAKDSVEDATGRDYSTIQSASWVARRVEKFRRRNNLAWSHHEAVAALPADQQDALLDRAEAEAWTVRQLRAEARREKAGRPDSAPKHAGSYSCIVADPPWRYGNTATRGAAEDHYPTMSVEEIEAIPVDQWAACDAHLYLWATNNFLSEAFRIVTAWGFDYRTLLTWVKPQIGMGNYFRSRTEHVLFATRGSLPTDRRDISNVIEARRTQHSRKPGAFYDVAEMQSPGPRLEMFARERRLGWDVWGNEA